MTSRRATTRRSTRRTSAGTVSPRSLPRRCRATSAGRHCAPATSRRRSRLPSRDGDHHTSGRRGPTATSHRRVGGQTSSGAGERQRSRRSPRRCQHDDGAAHRGQHRWHDDCRPVGGSGGASAEGRRSGRWFAHRRSAVGARRRAAACGAVVVQRTAVADRDRARRRACSPYLRSRSGSRIGSRFGAAGWSRNEAPRRAPRFVLPLLVAVPVWASTVAHDCNGACADTIRDNEVDRPQPPHQRAGRSGRFTNHLGDRQRDHRAARPSIDRRAWSGRAPDGRRRRRPELG